MEFILKDAIYTVAYVWSNVHKSTLIKPWHRLWHTIMLDNEPSDEHFEVMNRLYQTSLLTPKFYQPKV
jgi:hypothetical protein